MTDCTRRAGFAQGFWNQCGVSLTVCFSEQRTEKKGRKSKRNTDDEVGENKQIQQRNKKKKKREEKKERENVRIQYCKGESEK